jgi:hypothetical protein
VREEDGGEAAEGFLEDGEEERGCGGGGGVADADAWVGVWVSWGCAWKKVKGKR